MKLSVVVPVYNVENYILDCASSLLSQNYPDFEVVFVDDGSTDKSISILEKILAGKNKENFRIIHKQNAGLPQARKTGIEHATGEYVTFVDSDDWLEPDYLNNAMKYVENSCLDLYSLGYLDDRGTDGITEKAKPEDFQVLTLKEYFTALHKRQLYHTMCSKIISKKLLEDIFDFPTGNFIYEDYVTLIPALKYVNKIGLIPESGYHYRYRNDSMGHEGFSLGKKKGYEEITALYPRIVEWFPEEYTLINVFYSVEYMGLIMSMGRSDHYDKSIVKYIQPFIRKNILNVFKADYIEGRFKLSIIPLSVTPYVFSKLYTLALKCGIIKPN